VRPEDEATDRIVSREVSGVVGKIKVAWTIDTWFYCMLYSLEEMHFARGGFVVKKACSSDVVSWERDRRGYE
jgi:hypothetical protein